MSCSSTKSFDVKLLWDQMWALMENVPVSNVLFLIRAWVSAAFLYSFKKESIHLINIRLSNALQYRHGNMYVVGPQELPVTTSMFWLVTILEPRLFKDTIWFNTSILLICEAFYGSSLLIGDTGFIAADCLNNSAV